MISVLKPNLEALLLVKYLELVDPKYFAIQELVEITVVIDFTFIILKLFFEYLTFKFLQMFTNTCFL